jgi:hypothetical protein
MAESDFTLFGASAADIKRGVTAGITPPNGGGNFIFGFNSLVDESAAVGLYYNATDYAPLRDNSANPTGGSVRAALKRGQSPSPTGYSIGLYICLQGGSAPTISDSGYFLGLADNDPSEIVLAKVAPNAGLDPEATTALRISSTTYLWDTWLHLRLDAIVNPNGDVVLKCFESDLDTYAVSSPNWQPIGGMADYIDDALGINSGSNPLAGGWGGWAFHSEQTNARGYIDHFEFHRQA